LTRENVHAEHANCNARAGQGGGVASKGNTGSGYLTESQLRALVGIAAYAVRWGGGPPASWALDRMGRSGPQACAELEQLRRCGLIRGSDGQLFASREAVVLALAAWRALKG
jgi:hypothetical protein